jgi:hypothetical protein
MGTPDSSIKHYFSKSVLPIWQIFGKYLAKARFFNKPALWYSSQPKNRLLEETGLVRFWDFFNAFYLTLAYLCLFMLIYAYLIIYKQPFLGKTFLQNYF